MEAIEVLVQAPGRPDVIVTAASRLEAKVRAAMAWGCDFLDVEHDRRLRMSRAPKRKEEATA